MIKEIFKQALYRPLFNLLTFFAYLVPGHSIGWSIIFLTLLVRLALWLPSAKALKAPLQMRQYSAEIKQLQDRYKNDRAAQAQALMAFYKEKGINPLSGCLPLLIQLPVILILYRVFVAGLGSSRLDLLYSFTPHVDQISNIFLGIDLAKPDRIILPALAAILQFIQTRHYNQLNPTQTAGSDPTAAMTKQMQYIFPLMTYFIALSLPAGLALYWSTTTLFSLIQQIYVTRTFQPTTSGTVAVTVRTKKK